MADKGGTRKKILTAAAEIARVQGPSALTFDAVARELGISKQAVIYWFRTKEDLVSAVALPALREEADAAVEAVRDAQDGADAIRRFVRAIAGFHTADLDRFRLMYLSPQGSGRLKPSRHTATVMERIHPVSSAMYDALEQKLIGDSRFRSGPTPRRAAVIAHTSALGLVLMVSLADAVGDPLRHDTDSLVDTLTALLAGNRPS
jgi:AcrR family transcriptional regulator